MYHNRQSREYYYDSNIVGIGMTEAIYVNSSNL